MAAPSPYDSPRRTTSREIPPPPARLTRSPRIQSGGIEPRTLFGVQSQPEPLQGHEVDNNGQPIIVPISGNTDVWDPNSNPPPYLPTLERS